MLQLSSLRGRGKRKMEEGKKRKIAPCSSLRYAVERGAGRSPGSVGPLAVRLLRKPTALTPIKTHSLNLSGTPIINLSLFLHIAAAALLVLSPTK
jgi:hypothetical protein